MKTTEYKGDTITIHTYAIGKRFGWWWETGSGLKGENKESGMQTEDAAYLEAEGDAQLAVDKKRNG